jgi:hypothetical protein
MALAGTADGNYWIWTSLKKTHPGVSLPLVVSGVEIFGFSTVAFCLEFGLGVRQGDLGGIVGSSFDSSREELHQ